MAETLLQRFLEGVQTTSLTEWLAVATGVAYVLLIVRRQRLGWVAGGVSSLLFTVLTARAHLPMQAVLQFSYVVGAVYGWWSWSRGSAVRPIMVWHWRAHLLALAACLLLAAGLARLLAHESAAPFIDSLSACAGLFATWLLARMYLENWLYWIAIDAVSVYLFFSQGLVVTALLFVLYLSIAVTGLVSWRKNYRQQRVATP